MASTTFDGQSFLIDGRRVWLVSGSIHYARVPRQLWADRIHAAKLAGLNTIETAVYWARHEPRPGHFDFTGDNDLRHFIELIAGAGLHCILRPGPFVGATGWDLGGLPPWLLAMPGMKTRTNHPAFLEASSRFITAVAQQVRDLQVTAVGAGGPILLVQNEAGWTCGDDTLGETYLGELARYLREAGLNSLTVNANDLWQGVEGEVDCWTGYDSLFEHLRQLATVRPDQPRLVMSLRPVDQASWGTPAPEAPSPYALQRRLAEVLAAGAQFNLDPFHGGTNFGFWGGRLPDQHHRYATTSADRSAPLAEDGTPGESFHAVRKICTFANHFARVLANLSPASQPIIIHPESGRRGQPGVGVSVAHVQGSQGSIAFVMSDGSDDRPEAVPLLLPEGGTMTVPMGRQQVVWCLVGARLSGRARLDHTNLCVLGMVDRVLVCYGPAGSAGVVSINGSPLEVEVPSGASPLVAEHEGIQVVVCSEEQADQAFFAGSSVVLGASWISRTGEPVPAPGMGVCTQVTSAGARVWRADPPPAPPAPPPAAPAPTGKPPRKKAAAKASRRAGSPRPRSASVGALGRTLDPAPELTDWSMAPATEHAAGTSERYATIAGPASLPALGSPYGYGWYRIRLGGKGTTGKSAALFPTGGDRLQFILDGAPAGVMGVGPGAEPTLGLPLRKKQHTLVVLAENLGRCADGVDGHATHGLGGHLWSVTPIKAPKPKAVTGPPIYPMAVLPGPLWHVHADDATDPQRLAWSIDHRRKSPLIVMIGQVADRALAILNDQPVALIRPGGPSRLVFEPEALARGRNTLQIASLGPASTLAGIAQAITLWAGDTCLTEAAEWAFAKWEAPPPDAYERTSAKKPAAGGPTWWRCRFSAPADERPLYLDPSGLTKGQIYVNDRHVGRYFVADASGKAVPPQSRYYIPPCWLEAGGPNDIVLFDEHGGNPARAHLAFSAHD